MIPQGRACPGFASRARQRGAVALPVGLVLLVLATIGTFYVTRSSMIDQRVAADAIRARDAFEAAEAGMNFALSFMDVDGRDLYGDVGVDDRVEMLTELGLLDDDAKPSPSGVDDIEDNYGRELNCDANSDGDCNDAGEALYRLQARWSDTDVDGEADSYIWSFPAGAGDCDAGVRICLLMRQTDLTEVTVTSTGYADEGKDTSGAIKQITQQMRRVGAFPGNLAATHALISYGGVGVGGSMSVVNAFSNATIWAGADVTDFGSGPNSGTFIHPDPKGATYVTDAKTGDRIPYFDANDNKAADVGEYLLYGTSTIDDPAKIDDWKPKTDLDLDAFTKASGMYADPVSKKKTVTMGVDIIDNSSDLRCNKDPSTTPPGDPDCFFNNFIAGPPDFAKHAADYITTKDDLLDPGESYPVEGSFIWVDARSDDGTLGDFSIKGGTYGTREKPIILIIDGNFDPKAAPTIYGVVFVRGDIVGGGSGGGKLVGSMIVEGDDGFTESSGGMDIIYDPNVVGRSGGGEGRNAVVPIAGTWRDWQ